MKERIKQLRKALNLTQADFAEALHVTRSTVGIWETIDDRPPSAVTIALICEKYNVNRDWLEHGTGEMRRETTTAEKVIDLMNATIHPDGSERWQTARATIIESLAEMPPEFWEQAAALLDEILKRGK